MRGITKRFPGIIANDNINLVVKKGEIHALLGENGAGKSTLMNVLFGLYQPEEGEILINEKPVKITSPSVANDLGIGMVHQHFMLVEKFTVTENIVLGNEPKSGLQIDMQSAIKAVEKLSNQYGLKVDPRAKIEDISVGMQQRVEILKTLYRGADILIFDEPTAVLTPQEIVELIEIMHNLVKEGKTIILITHKLKEIMAVCDTVTIIRRGKVIDSVGVKDTNPDDLAAKMVGREVNFRVDKKEANPKEVILSVENITAMGNRGVNALNSISLEVRSGEILGIAGVDGNGQSELIEVLTGLRKASSGRVLLKGQDITNKTPRVISESGLSHIPEDRHKHGLVLDFPMSENMVLETYFHPEFNKNGFLDYAAIDKHASKLIEEFDVRTPSIHTPARALSGGNQQKAIIAREVNKDPDLLIAAQPTRGLDVGAIEFIHRRLIEQRDKGKAVLLLSLELDEIINVSDRIAVIYEGQIVGIVDAKQTDEQELGLMMSGGKRMQGGGNGE
ncbi:MULTISPECIES: ABC transporter ATP-binding protein [Brevibacillus]|jgi:simple sugar transport system ATP-binding protein|nr:ABC transporter ATP-binding protein [Brevibacillus borstelensis]KKX54220.1 heme ABC transporter ATP-binding protein [Brevibacillus borstelensis cifa_chp40]MBE5397968.1 ABC transporter ATP-binding protein [Brevibacillus borstelensis]MCC0563518.1 ABC transporter ATP-binding protein [Brevibacillus borstelensis]MCM3469673.1 ABC transporter ATP-binding protein [Brevibacillus borstelensis]MCM3557899.1 ABC transporter ATP-binding protein [Brevibacillus borstelensis]